MNTKSIVFFSFRQQKKSRYVEYIRLLNKNLARFLASFCRAVICLKINGQNMRHILFSFVIILVVSIGFIMRIDNSPKSDEIPEGILRFSFNPVSLEGSWFSPGLFHNVEEDYNMSVMGYLDIISTKNKNEFMTYMNSEGGEYFYSDSGQLRIINDSVFWDIWEFGYEKMSYKGKLEGDIIYLISEEDGIKQKYLLYFVLPNQLYYRNEIFVDLAKTNWVEYSFRKEA